MDRLRYILNRTRESLLAMTEPSVNSSGFEAKLWRPGEAARIDRLHSMLIKVEEIAGSLVIEREE